MWDDHLFCKTFRGFISYNDIGFETKPTKVSIIPKRGKQRKGVTDIMRKRRLLLAMTVMLCVSALAGCSKGSKEDGGSKENGNTGYKKIPITEDADNNNGTKDADSNNGSIPDSSDADSLISHSEIQGHVLEFSDTGCVISPQKTEEVDGGEVAREAAFGYENEKDNVHVHYSADCQFQFAKISISTGKIALSDADISNIKKQTGLIIYGEQSDDHNIEATKVFLVRYE